MIIVNGRSLRQDHEYFLECAKIHYKEIPNGFLPSLGIPFLSSLYQFFSKSKYSSLLIAVENYTVVGFIAISLNTKLLFKEYLWKESYKNLHKILISKLGIITILKIIEVLKYPFKSKKKKNDFISNSEILNFCVVSSMQGRGVGQLLFSEAVKELDNNKIKILKIVTGQNQISAQKFYDKCGAIFSHKIVIHDKKYSDVYKYKIN